MDDKKSELDNSNPNLAQQDKKEDIVIEEKIPSDIVRELPKVVEAIERLERSNITIEGSRHYQGPLPLQLLEKLDKDQCDKIIDDMMLSKKQNQENQRFFLTRIFEDQNSDRSHSTFKYIFISVIGLIIFLTLVFTNNSAIIDKYLPALFAFLGGGGIVLYNVSKKKKQLTLDRDEEQDEH